jgi:hypothetical protein
MKILEVPEVIVSSLRLGDFLVWLRLSCMDYTGIKHDVLHVTEDY